MDSIPVYSKLVSESLLSLYPTFVKKISLPIDLQLWTRLITYVLISLFFINYSWIVSNIFTSEAIILTMINLLHIYSSYEGFLNLDSGISFSIFNIYPLLILLFSGVSWKFEYFYCIVGLILFMVSNFINNNIKSNDTFMYGFVMMVVAAITEALIYFVVKNIKTDNNWNQLFIAYFFGAILSSLYIFKKYILEEKSSNKKKEDFENNSEINFGLIGLALIINGLIGTIGYWLRFYSIYRLDPSIYSILSFFGIIMAYVYGILFNNEKLDLLKISGTILIILSNLLVL
jgi:drug/metabolite transporter (DMT)-like permease